MPSPEIMIEPRPVQGRPVPERRAEPLPAAKASARVRAPRRWPRRFGWLCFIVLLWCGWTAYSLYDLGAALDSGDAVALERRVDWARVRDGLREDLRVMLASGRAGEPAPDATVNPLTTQRAIAALIRSARFNGRGWDMEPRRGRSSDLLRIRHAFFSGGPFAFRVDLKPENTSVRRPLVLLLRWNGDWQLTRVFLPADAFGNAPPAPQPAVSSAPQAAAPAAPASPATAKGAPADAQRVMLYEEDPSDPNGKSYEGWVVWRTDPGASGNAADAAIICQVALPDRPMAVTLTIRRNLDQALPASHTVDVKFDIPANSPTQGVRDVVGIMMKPNEEASGQQMAGNRVKVSKDFFLIGLSAIELDVQQNMQVLRDRPWLGIPFIYNSNQRAVLSIEKGETGGKIINEALARWGNIADAGKPKR